MWRIAFQTLIADRGKLLTALIGVVFSVVLVNVQGGLFVGLIQKASLLVDRNSADLWVGHKRMKNVDFAHDIPREWGQRIASAPGVLRCDPYIVGHSVMTLPSGGFEQVLVVGGRPESFGSGIAATSDIKTLRQTDGILVDACDEDKLESQHLGDVREIGQRRARVVGFTQGVLGFLVTPYVFTTLDRAREYLHKSSDRVSYFLVRAEKGVDPQTLCEVLRQRLPEAEIRTRAEYGHDSIQYWMRRTGVGISFGASTLLGLTVGLVIVAQTLYASVLGRIIEIGALKAIGAREPQILGLVLRQALMLAAAGSSIGVLTACLLKSAFSTPRAPIDVSAAMLAASCVLVTVICVASSVFPYWRIRAVDPVIVLQG